MAKKGSQVHSKKMTVKPHKTKKIKNLQGSAPHLAAQSSH